MPGLPASVALAVEPAVADAVLVGIALHIIRRLLGREYRESDSRSGDVRAAQVVKGSSAAGDKTEARSRSAWKSILESVPKGVDLTEELTTANLVPILLGILGAWGSLVGLRTANGPASLSDPDRLALRSSLGLSVGRVEEILADANVVGHGALEVRIGIHSNEIRVLGNSTDRGVYPSCPSINVANRSGYSRALDGGPDLVDVA